VKPSPPSAKTLARYGLSAEEWLAILERQFGVCAVCGRLPNPPKPRLLKSGEVRQLGPQFNIDHDHIKGFKKLPPEKRKQHVRGVVCHYCNRFLLARITLLKAEAVVAYLTAHNERLLNKAMGAP